MDDLLGFAIAALLDETTSMDIWILGVYIYIIRADNPALISSLQSSGCRVGVYWVRCLLGCVQFFTQREGGAVTRKKNKLLC